MVGTIPTLIEPTTKLFLHEKLRQCHNTRANIYSTIVNVAIIAIFFGFASFVLYTIYVNRPTDEEQYEKNLTNQHIIMNKIKEFRTVPAKVTQIVEYNTNYI
jgi:hypothetical protein